MKLPEFNKIFFYNAFSEARMKPYFDRYPKNEKKAILSYEQNIRLAESLEPSLSIFEVTLRNAIIRELVKMTGKDDWYEFFKSEPKLKELYKYINIAINHIKRRGETITIDKINGELTLGFWVSLFNAEYEKILWKNLRMVFHNMPKKMRQRKNISAPLNTIRSLRNRVFHNENISWNLVKFEERHTLLIKVIEWMNPKVKIWMKCIDRFNFVILKIKCNRYGWYKVLIKK